MTHFCGQSPQRAGSPCCNTDWFHDCVDAGTEAATRIAYRLFVEQGLNGSLGVRGRVCDFQKSPPTTSPRPTLPTAISEIRTPDPAFTGAASQAQFAK